MILYQGHVGRVWRWSAAGKQRRRGPGFQCRLVSVVVMIIISAVVTVARERRRLRAPGLSAGMRGVGTSGGDGGNVGAALARRECCCVPGLIGGMRGV
jgi:hypothetical protein